MPTDRTPDIRRRSEHARSAVLTAAADLLTEVGYARLTVEAIAARAGVGKQTIYRWWPSKGAVVFDALLELNRSEGGLALPNSGDLRSDLRQVLRATVDELLDERTDAVYRAVFAEIQSDATLSTELTTRLLAPLREALTARLRAAVARREVDDQVDLDVVVEMLVGPVFHRWLLRTAALDQGYADAVVDLALRAARPGA